MQPGGRAPEVELLGDRYEVAEVTKFDDPRGTKNIFRANI